MSTLKLRLPIYSFDWKVTVISDEPIVVSIGQKLKLTTLFCCSTIGGDNIPLETTASTLIQNGVDIVCCHFGCEIDQLWYQFWKSEDSLSSTVFSIHPCFDPIFRISRIPLYVRRAYLDLSKHVEEMWAEQLRNNMYSPIVIEGTPGIGKTFFMIYMLYICRQNGLDVAFSTLSKYFILDSWLPRMVSQEAFDNYLSKSSSNSVVYLYDPNQVHESKQSKPNITGFNGRTLITTSQDDRILSQLRDTPKEYFYMPVWTLTELLQCRSHSYAHMPEEKVCKNFIRWGGSARHVFWCGDSRAIEKRLLEATTNYSTMESIVSRMTSQFTAKHPYRPHQWLWHMIVYNSYRDYIYEWPSIYIQSVIFQNIKKMEWSFSNRISLMKNSNSIKAGNIYDAYVRFIFLKFPGGHLKIKNLTRSTTEPVPFPTKGIHFFDSQILHEPNALYIPIRQNQESIDLVYPPYMMQITQSKNHTIKNKGIEEIKRIFYKVKDWKLCFIVPDAIKECVTIPDKNMDKCVTCIDYDEHMSEEELEMQL